MLRVEDLDTPAVIVFLDRLEANIARVQSLIARQGIGNRPHIKTHKIPAIAQMQMQAGAVGLTCQKLGELEVFVDAGVCDDYLLTYNIIGPHKTDRLMRLAGRVKRLAVVADNDVVLRGLSEAGLRHSRDIPLLIECDTGFGRNGVQSPEAALDLARLALKLPRIAFEGLMMFPNTAPHTHEFFTRAVKLFREAGIKLPVVSGGGTPALNSLAEFPMMTEHRAGTYVYNDVMMVHSGVASWQDCALQVRATVVSRPSPARAVLDCGSKVLTSDQYYVQHYGRLADYPGAVISALSEEHAIVDLTAVSKRPKIGEVVNVIPNHCCSVSNMNDEVHGVRNGVVELTWPVAARGKVR
ncbi:D-TA family PLP-dependent enzyme [Nordella sp. HKS 07]|uniref:alanine racemase n=1 Tax=Nordella sp. HKS 07 TaxID=2712222 RepID=UPI0013E1F273|nr:alanine racemase [Nordella sp. HKS 07]QIG47804.1 D-TA family PLP-dependent enzyme [Nordella sp. HKS 07]